MDIVKDGLAKIAEVEIQAADIDPDDKDALYDLLVGAYFTAKDVIKALQTMQPVPAAIVDTDRIDELEYSLKTVKAELAIELAARDICLDQLSKIREIVVIPA